MVFHPSLEWRAKKVAALWYKHIQYTPTIPFVPLFFRYINRDCDIAKRAGADFTHQRYGVIQLRVCRISQCTWLVRKKNNRASQLAEIAAWDPVFFGSLRNTFATMREEGLMKRFRDHSGGEYKWPSDALFDAIAALQEFPEMESMCVKEED